MRALRPCTQHENAPSRFHAAVVWAILIRGPPPGAAEMPFERSRASSDVITAAAGSQSCRAADVIVEREGTAQ